MPSSLSHAVAGLAVAAWCRPADSGRRVLVLAAACGAAPDLDLIGWAFDIPNESVFGHRAISHSLTAALALGAFATWLLLRNDDAQRTGARIARLVALFSIATATHGVFDAMSTYSLGIEFFAPFSLRRYRFPFQPLTDPFYDGVARGIWNEILWVLLPSLVIAIAGLRSRQRRDRVRSD